MGRKTPYYLGDMTSDFSFSVVILNFIQAGTFAILFHNFVFRRKQDRSLPV